MSLGNIMLTGFRALSFNFSSQPTFTWHFYEVDLNRNFNFSSSDVPELLNISNEGNGTYSFNPNPRSRSPLPETRLRINLARIRETGEIIIQAQETPRIVRTCADGSQGQIVYVRVGHLTS